METLSGFIQIQRDQIRIQNKKSRMNTLIEFATKN